MSRRIDVELTSVRDDGSWTWRAAGARQPRGVLDGALLVGQPSVGDVVRVEADFDVDGITIQAVLPPKREERSSAERLELLGRPEPEQMVTTSLVGKRGRSDGPPRGDRGRRDRKPGGDRGRRNDGPPRGDRPERGDRPRRDAGNGRPPRDADRDRPPRDEAPRRESRRGDRPASSPREERPERPERSERRPSGDRRSRTPRPSRPATESRPRPKRLRPARTHRRAVLDALPEEQTAVAEQVLRGGVPAVRQAADQQNEQARAEGRPEVPVAALVAMAEQLLPRLRSAEWRDRAEAALAELADLDLRDLRSVVVAADAGARDNETRAMAAELRQGLTRRVEEEQGKWLSEMASTLAEGRTVRALRLSSRPPKAGAPLPPDLAGRLSDAAGAALTAETVPDRWATVLDALSFSPVRLAVSPASVPNEPGEPLLAVVRKVADRVPKVAAAFGVGSRT